MSPRDDPAEYEDDATTRLHALNRWVFASGFVVAVVIFFGLGPAILGWVVGAVPVAALCLLARYWSRRVDEPVRGSVVCTLLVAGMLWWIAFTTAAMLMLAAVLVLALPRRAWRLHVLGPMMAGTALATILHPIGEWAIPPVHMMFPTFWLLTLHVVALGVVVVKLCRLPA